MNTKTIESKEAEQLQALNMYLAAGNGRGRLSSAATVWDGKIGYFCVHPIYIHGVRQGDCILFACAPHEDILITAFPLHPNCIGMSTSESLALYEEARRKYPVPLTRPASRAAKAIRAS